MNLKSLFLFVIASYSAIAFPALSLFAEESTRISSLTIPRVDLKIRSLNVSQRGTDVHYYLEAPLELGGTLPDQINGSLEFSPFFVGVLLGEDGNEERIGISPALNRSILATIRNGKINVHFTTTLNNLPKEGFIEIAINFKKIFINNVVYPDLTAVYDLGDIKRISSNMQGQLLPPTSIPLKNIITPHQLLSKMDPKIQSILKKLRYTNQYYFELLDAHQNGVNIGKERASSRSVKFNVTAHIKDPILNSKVIYRSFTVQALPTVETCEDFERINDSTPIVKTFPSGQDDANNFDTKGLGYIYWSDEIEHRWYVQQKRLIKPYRIIDNESGVQKLLGLVLIPWDTGWIFDTDFRKSNCADIDYRHNIVPETLIHNVGFTFEDHTLNMNDWLDLNLTKQYVLTLQPKVVRHDSITKGRLGPSSPLRDGYYMLAVAFSTGANPLKVKPENIVNSWTNIVAVRGGQINTRIKITLEELAHATIMNQMYFQILTIDESLVELNPDGSINQELTLNKPNLIDWNSGLKMMTYSGPVILRNPSQNPGLAPVYHTSAWELIEKSKSRLNRSKHTLTVQENLDLYRKIHNLVPIDMAQPDQAALLGNQSKLNQSNFDEIFETLPLASEHQAYREASIQRDLCNIWTHTIMPTNLNTEWRRNNKWEFQDLQVKRLLKEFYRSCMYHARREPFFMVDKQLIVHHIRPELTQYGGGNSFNLHVASSFSLSKNRYQDNRRGLQSGLTVSLSKSFLKDAPLFSIGINRSENFSSSESQGNGISQGESTVYTNGAFLVLENSDIHFTSDKYEKCIAAKPSASMIREFLDTDIGYILGYKDDVETIVDQIENSFWEDLFGYFKTSAVDGTDKKLKEGGFWSFNASDRTTEERKVKKYRDLADPEFLQDVFSRGIHLCKGEIEEEPIAATEHFSYVLQHFIIGNMQNPYDQKNRPWLMLIRSLRDLVVFLEAMQDNKRMNHVGNIEYTPAEKLIDYYKVYRENLSSWPGIYSFQQLKPPSPGNCSEQDDQTFAETISQRLVELLTAPFDKKDGRNMMFDSGDFWVNYYCEK